MSCRVMRSDGLHLEDIHMTFCQLVDIDIDTDTDKNKTEEHSNMETSITLSENQHYSQ